MNGARLLGVATSRAPRSMRGRMTAAAAGSPMTGRLVSYPAPYPRSCEDAAIASCLYGYGKLANVDLNDHEALRLYRQRIYKARIRLAELMVKPGDPSTT